MVFSKKHTANSGKHVIACLFLLLIMFYTSNAEMIVENPTTDPANATAAEATIQEEGTQLQTGPVLMVTDYVVVEGDTLPGSSFVVKMSIANLSEYASAYNVLATLKIENISVSLQETFTNQVYFHEILPTETVYAYFPLEVYSYCAEENMILSMTMTCYDAAAVHYEFQTMMTPNVDVVRSLQVTSLTVPQFVHRNSGMIISAALTNTEPVTLTNVKMHVVTRHSEQITEIGQLLSGESKTTDCIYRFPEQQTENVEVFFTYESLYGHVFSSAPQTFEVVVYDPAEENNYSQPGKFNVKEIVERLSQNTVVPMVNETLPVPVFAWVALGLIGYIVVLYCVLRQKRR